MTRIDLVIMLVMVFVFVSCNWYWPGKYDVRVAAALVRHADFRYPQIAGCDEIRFYADRKKQYGYEIVRRINGQWEYAGSVIVTGDPLGYGSGD